MREEERSAVGSERTNSERESVIVELITISYISTCAPHAIYRTAIDVRDVSSNE